MKDELKIKSYRPEHDRGIEKIDGTMLPELRQGDYLSESRFVAVNGAGEVKAVGYLLRGPEDGSRVFIHLHFQSSVDDQGVLASEMMLETLIARFEEEKERDSRERILRTWANQKGTAYLDFLLERGFRAEAKMFAMEGELQSGVSGTTPEPVPRPLDLLHDRALFREYLRVNGEAFGIPDPPGGIRYKLNILNARIFGIVREDGKKKELIAALSTWNEGGQTAATEDIFTAKEYRRQGLMESLLRYVHGLLYGEGIRYVRLAVYSDDLPALRLYRKLGYRKTKTLIEVCYR